MKATVEGRNRGVTLIEALAVLAVVAVLLAVLVPVLGASRRKAYATDDLSRLRQLGQAASLYQSTADRWPRGVPDLVNAGLVPKELGASTLDRSSVGIANELAASWGKDRRPSTPNDVPYRLSFVGQREARINEEIVDRFILTNPTGGWVVDLMQARKGNLPDYSDAKGRYRRLQYDGAVGWRPFVNLEALDTPRLGLARSSVTLFVEPSEEFKAWFKALG